MLPYRFPIGTEVNSINITDGENIIANVNENTLQGQSANTLMCEIHMENNDVIVELFQERQEYINANGYVIPIYIKYSILTVNVSKPMEQ